MTINSLHFELQSAYKKQHRTESALLKVKNDILLNMDAQKVTLLVLLDLSAAFATVCHGILLDWLRSRFGVTDRALNWFNRTSRTVHSVWQLMEGCQIPFRLRKGCHKGHPLAHFYSQYIPANYLIFVSGSTLAKCALLRQ